MAIPAGQVAIRESLPLGWAITYPVVGYHLVDVHAGRERSRTIDFGNFASFDFGDAPAAPAIRHLQPTAVPTTA